MTENKGDKMISLGKIEVKLVEPKKVLRMKILLLKF